MDLFPGLRIVYFAAKGCDDAQGSRFKGVFTMRFIKTAMTAVAAVSMVAMPVVAQAAQNRAAVSKLSVGAAPVSRVGATVRDTNKDGDGGSIIIALLAAAAVVAGIVIAADNNNTPTSA